MIMAGYDYLRRKRFGFMSLGIPFILVSFLVLNRSGIVHHGEQSSQTTSYSSSSSTSNSNKIGTSQLELLQSQLPPPLDPSEITPTHRDRGTLPDFTNGGIVVFYHIYKTGGSTVGKLFNEIFQRDRFKRDQHFNGFGNSNNNNKSKMRNNKKSSSSSASSSSSSSSSSNYHPPRNNNTTVNPKLYFTMIRKNIDWKRDCLTTLNMAEKEKKLILLELHVEHPAPNFPSLVEMAPMIQHWRKEADNRNIGFFAFTMVREPVAHALSFFNFFHVGHNDFRPPPTLIDHDYWNPFQPLNMSESNFLHSNYMNNRQCRMFGSDPEATKSAPDDLVWKTKKQQQEGTDTDTDTDELFVAHHQQQNNNNNIPTCQVDKVHDALFESMDWVGTTEHMQNETLPLLTKLIVNDPSLGRKNNPYKVFDKAGGTPGMKKKDLSDEGLSQIIEQTNLDRRLYGDVQRTFALSDFGWDYESLVV
jgi:hypothetical protein